MRKIDIKELIVIGVGTLALCFTVSKFVLCKFQMQTDFLSASATIFAAVVAMMLYNDWREPHKLMKFQTEINEIRASIRLFRNNYYTFSSHVLKFQQGESTSGPYFQEYIELERELLNSLDDLSENLEFYSLNFLENFTDEAMNTHKDNLIVYSKLLIDFHSKFMGVDIYKEFTRAFAVVDVNVRNNYFMEIIEKITKDLPNELAKVSIKMTELSGNEIGR